MEIYPPTAMTDEYEIVFGWYENNNPDILKTILFQAPDLNRDILMDVMDDALERLIEINGNEKFLFPKFPEEIFDEDEELEQNFEYTKVDPGVRRSKQLQPSSSRKNFN